MKEKIVLTVFSPLLLLGENVFASVFEERTLNADAVRKSNSGSKKEKE